jgi:hypothetical protein
MRLTPWAECMSGKIFRITGSSFVKTGSVTDGHPVEFRHWQEVVDEAENFLESAVNSEEEEAVVELWLEDPMSFQAYFNNEEGATPMGPGVSRTAGSMVRHADAFGRKQAVVRETNWDEEFADAKAHAASVLKNLGNGR